MFMCFKYMLVSISYKYKLVNISTLAYFSKFKNAKKNTKGI